PQHRTTNNDASQTSCQTCRTLPYTTCFTDCQPKPLKHATHNASASSSPVRMRTARSSGCTNTLPSPILPVLADLRIASTTGSTWSSVTATSSLILGRKSTTYSAPRYRSVWPSCRPKPLTSVTVMPVTPTSASASRTSSSLNGLMIAMTIFIASPPGQVGTG